MDQDRRKHKHERSDHGGKDGENVKRSSSPRGGAIHVDVAVPVENLPPPPPALRECNICGKTFTNGKALGGHRRSHFEALKKNINKVNNKTPNHSSKVVVHNNRASNCGGVGVVDVVDNRTCYVCKKEFPTKNALFGHMRSHPRDWTGLYPPPSSSSSSSEDDSEEEEDWRGVDVNVAAPVPAIDLTKFTSPSWRKTDRRGRKCIGNYEAARNLMYFSADCCVAQFSCNDLHVTPKAKSTTSTPEVLLPCKKREIGESAEGNSVKKIKFVLSGSFNLGNNKTEDGAEAAAGDQSVKTEFNPVKLLQDHDGGDYFDERKVSCLSKGHDQKSKSIQCLKDSSTSHEDEAQKYTCGTCGKTFSTFQGLGGHRSIHKLKNKVTEDQENSSSCKMDEITPPVSEATVADEEAGQSTGPKGKGLDIDLNEPYFED